MLQTNFRQLSSKKENQNNSLIHKTSASIFTWKNNWGRLSFSYQ